MPSDEDYEKYYGLDAQQIHDAQMAERKFKIDKAKVQELLESVRKPENLTMPEMIRRQGAGEPFNPADFKDSLIERVMKRHGFTREEAIEELEKFGV